MIKLISIFSAVLLTVSGASCAVGNMQGKAAYRKKADLEIAKLVKKQAKDIAKLVEEVEMQRIENEQLAKKYSRKLRASPVAASLRSVPIPPELRIPEGPVTSASITGEPEDSMRERGRN